jgi:hypothetical protein
MQTCLSNQWHDDSFCEMVKRIKSYSLESMADEGLRKMVDEDTVVFDKAVLFSILSEAWPAGNA